MRISRLAVVASLAGVALTLTSCTSQARTTSSAALTPARSGAPTTRPPAAATPPSSPSTSRSTSTSTPLGTPNGTSGSIAHGTSGSTPRATGRDQRQVSTAQPVPAAGCPRGGGASAAWASWPMPNPAGSGLPNPARYTADQSTVRDAVTCLLWQRSPASASYPWAQAKSYCAALALEGGGWHLPSRVELTSITDYTRAGPAIDRAAFPGTPSAFFWTSSPWAVHASTPRAWIVNFYEGLASNGAFQSGAHRVRCVRSAAGAGGASYAGAGSGQVRDTRTGLTWQRGTAAAPSQPAATAVCRSLALGGQRWRLPSIKELATTVDESRVAPAIVLSAFPGTVSKGWYWSSSASADSAKSWALNYEDGYTSRRDAGPGYVRCVR